MSSQLESDVNDPVGPFIALTNRVLKCEAGIKAIVDSVDGIANHWEHVHKQLQAEACKEAGRRWWATYNAAITGLLASSPNTTTRAEELHEAARGYADHVHGELVP